MRELRSAAARLLVADAAPIDALQAEYERAAAALKELCHG